MRTVAKKDKAKPDEQKPVDIQVAIAWFEEQRKIRLHITRYTDYGERYKMYAFLIEPQSKTSVLDLTGLELDKNENEKYK